MRAEQIIAKIMLEMAGVGVVVGSLSDIAKRIRDHKDWGEDVSEVTLQLTPLGLHSREVAEFVGRLVAGGLATQVYPVKLTQNGLEWLRKNAI